MGRLGYEFLGLVRIATSWLLIFLAEQRFFTLRLMLMLIPYLSGIYIKFGQLIKFEYNSVSFAKHFILNMVAYKC